MVGEAGVLLWRPTVHGGLNGAQASVWGKYSRRAGSQFVLMDVQHKTTAFSGEIILDT